MRITTIGDKESITATVIATTMSPTFSRAIGGIEAYF